MLRLATLSLLALTLAVPAFADDRHAGYYYPTPETTEVYEARTDVDAAADRSARIAFAIEMTAGIMSRPHAPDYALFVKGAEAEKLIIVALRNGVIDTLYQGRALLALLTGIVRDTELFREMGVQDYFTFFDLARLLGFEQLTISDGRTWAHQVKFE
ncbi:MAG: molybdopterin-guanine dinucleotide biosynthesis protein A [Pseudomonadota bacterium]